MHRRIVQTPDHTPREMLPTEFAWTIRASMLIVRAMRTPAGVLLTCLFLLLLSTASALALDPCDPSCALCSGPASTDCTSCSAGRFLSGGSCIACSPVAACTSALNCTTSSDSQCTSCAFGTYVDNASGFASVCATCPPVS